MQITWDEPKRLSNLAKHGVDFADLTVDFFLASVIVPAHSGRYKALGRQDGNLLSVVFAPLGTEAVSLISARPASKKERDLHGEAT